MAHPCLHVRKSPSRPTPLPLMGPGIPNETFLHKSNNPCETVTVKRKKTFDSLNGRHKPKRYSRQDEPEDRSLGVSRTFGLCGDNERLEGLLMKQERRRSFSSVHTSSSCHHKSSLNVIYYNKAGVSMARLLLFVLLLAAAAAQGVYLRQEPQALTVRKGAPAWLHCRASLSPGPGPTRGRGPHGDDEDFFDPLLEGEDPEYHLQEGDDLHHPLHEGDDEAGITYQWLKDGQLLPPDARRRVLTNGTLFLEAVSSSRQELTDEGSYQCQATTAAGTVLSVPARLSIARLSKFTRGPEDMQAYEGEKAYFACSLGGSDLPHAGGDEGLTVSWHRDDAPLLLDSRMTMLPSGSLEISNLQLTDAATYHCHVSHMGKTKVSDVARLTVTPGGARRPSSRPSFIARPASQVVAAGASVSLDCAANGHPPPAVQWLKDGATLDLQDLDSRAVLVGPTWGLQLREARESDAGAYMCRASNGLDSEDAVAHLSVRVPPHVVTGPPAVVVAREREDALVRCTITGVPRPLVAWYKNAELITPSEYFQQVPDEGLRILGVVQGDAGMYQCFGTSVAGTVQATTRLLVHPAGTADNSGDNNSGDNSDNNSEINSAVDVDDSDNRSGKASNNSSVPGAPREVRALSTSNRHLTLTWRPPLLGASYVTRYIVTYRSVQSPRERVVTVGAGASEETSADEQRTHISGLTPGTTYLVSVAAAGPAHLVGPASPPLEVSTRPDLDLPTAPTNLTVTPTSPTALLVSWAPPAPVGHDSPLTAYKLYYMPVGSGEEQQVLIPAPPDGPPPTSHLLTPLAPFTQYSVWLVGVNRHGEGDAPREEVGRTYSAAPTSPPSNPRLEPASSRSLILRWEPPPLEHQNGVITGYKIKFRERGAESELAESAESAGTRTPDGSRRLYVLTNLKRHTHYQVRMSALTVNGSGPWTPWLYGQTYASDLDETTVPGTPTGLVANAKSSSVSVRWEAPSSPGGGALVRGYTVGWGRGIPDVYTKIVDATKRRYTIEHLDPNAEYVISVRAFNNVGDGQPVYEQVNTRPPDPDPPHRLRTPLALKAEVMTAYSVALSWTDTALNDNQFVGDRGYYTVRYTSYASASSSSPRYKYMNVSDVTCLIDNLKPATMYEFTVKAVRGNRDSRWSLVATNTTLEAKPSSPPRDVTVVTIRNQPSTVVVNWQPPRHANGRITGYLILYTTDPSLPWGVEQVEGDRLSHTLTPLTPHTTYHYKLQARNAKGHSPFTPVANFTTLMAAAATAPDGGSLFSGWSSVVVVAVVVAVAVVLLLLGVALFALIYCRRKQPHQVDPNPRHTGTSKSATKVEVSQPPDLWIHHDRLELNHLDNHNASRPASPAITTTVLNHGEGGELEDKNTYTSTSTLDRRTPYHSTYLREAGDETERLLHRPPLHPPGALQPPHYLMGGSTSSSVYSDGTMGGRPPHTPHAPYTLDPYATPGLAPHVPPRPGPSPLDPLPPPPPSLMAGLDPLYSDGNNTLGKSLRTASSGASGTLNPLRSFSVPGPPPPQSAPTTPHPKHYGGMGPPSSPFKKLPPPSPHCATMLGAPPVGGRRVLPPITRVDSLPEEEGARYPPGELSMGVSTEQLSQEMACLEGLMKDLSAITASQLY